jgi:hypothetical protein
MGYNLARQPAVRSDSMTQTFFVPLAKSPEEAERVYQLFVEKTGCPLAHPTSRLQGITFRRYKGKCYTATVNSEIPNWPEPGGRVFAIIEFMDFIQIFTTFCAWLYPIRVLPGEVSERVYFQDYFPQSQDLTRLQDLAPGNLHHSM